MEFSAITRKKNIERLKEEVFDLVIIGGGITGAGVARDAASRGLRVALVEARDFAEGTSSRSSKFIHGGVRYLENFEFGLVFEALSERALLFKLAPHLVHPLRFVIPIYKKSRVGYWKMLAGMWLYDLLALFETPQMHESLNSEEVQERLPDLNSTELVGAMEYSDAYTDDDRLVVETLRDANRRGACLVNYLRVDTVEGDQSDVHSLNVVDSLTGESFEVKGVQYLSSVGPWTDIFGHSVDKSWKDRLRPTKGVHLVFSREKIPVKKAVVMAVEKRIIFVIPRHEMVIVGTTDTDFQQNPETVTTDSSDVTYILKALNDYFPNLNVQEEDIYSSYAGVRPLVNDGSSTEGKTSREHEIWSTGQNLTFIAGGKYTTYRKMSEETVDHILSKMTFDKSMAFSQSQTKEALNPRVTQTLFDRILLKEKYYAEKYNLDSSIVQRLLFRHGDEAVDIMKIIAEHYSCYTGSEAYWMGEAHFAIQNTMCLTLKDFYWRRSPLFLSTMDHGIQYLKNITKVFEDLLDWDEEKVRYEQEKLLSKMKDELSWKKNTEAEF